MMIDFLTYGAEVLGSGFLAGLAVFSFFSMRDKKHGRKSWT
jgi:hypothetical protein